MTDELEGQGHIVEFVSGGPKNYGYVTSEGKYCCKVRGFTLNVRGQAKLNYGVMKDNILKEIKDPQDERRITVVDNPYFFNRHPATKRIKVESHPKKYGLVFDKRVIDPDTFVSYPYGYHSFLTNEDFEMAELLVN